MNRFQTAALTDLSLVGLTGNYNDLSNKPTIPSAQIQSDYTQTSSGAVDFIKNKPTLGTAASHAFGDFATALQGIKADNAVPITTRINGYALSGNVTLAQADIGLSAVNNTSDVNKPVSTAQAASIATKFTIPTGTTLDYIRGDGSILAFPTSFPASMITGTFLSSVISNFATAVNALISAALATFKQINFYGPSGPISITKEWVGTVTPTSASGFVVDISSAGFTNVLGAFPIAIKNTATATSSPQVSVKSFSNTQVVLNFTEATSSLVSVLGFNVLQGVPVQFASLTGLSCQLVVVGN